MRISRAILRGNSRPNDFHLHYEGKFAIIFICPRSVSAKPSRDVGRRLDGCPRSSTEEQDGSNVKAGGSNPSEGATPSLFELRSVNYIKFTRRSFSEDVVVIV